MQTMIIAVLIISILIICFWGAFGWLYWKDYKARKDFEKRQERYKRMI